MAMETGFVEKDDWVLPTSGTIGNKSRNLLENRSVILGEGLKILRSLTIPWEYLKAASHPEEFVMEQIDRYFSGWKRMLVRSDAPDEDLRRRFSGQYHSDYLWHEDRGPDTSEFFIRRVLKSYNHCTAKIRRSQFGLPEKGMGLLIQPPVSNSPDCLFDADYSGCFSDIGELALLTFTSPQNDVDAMQLEPYRKYWVDQKGGLLSEPTTSDDPVIAQRLRKLVGSLPPIEGKGWEIEFLQNREGLYVVQTTPVRKSRKVVVPDTIDSIFDAVEVVGTDEMLTSGILCVPYLSYSISEVIDGNRKEELERLIRFDAAHEDYCLVTVHHNLTRDDLSPNLLQYVMNPSVIIDLETDFIREFAPHVEQFLREGRVAVAGSFNDRSKLRDLRSLLLRGTIDPKLSYSPTPLLVRTDEATKKAHIGLADGKVKKFTRV